MGNQYYDLYNLLKLKLEREPDKRELEELDKYCLSRAEDIATAAKLNDRIDACPRCSQKKFTCSDNGMGFCFVRCDTCVLCGPAVARFEFEGPQGWRYLDQQNQAIALWNIFVRMYSLHRASGGESVFTYNPPKDR